MSADASNTLAILLPVAITSMASLVAALIAAGVALWSNGKSNKNAFAIEDFKSAVGHDLEHLKAKLVYGQVISSTQWNAEFSAYQAIWKGLVAIRIAAAKTVDFEAELIAAGLPDEYLSVNHTAERTKRLAETLQAANKQAVAAIHDNAPFYPAPIRESANRSYGASVGLLKTMLGAVLDLTNGKDTVLSSEFRAACVERWLQISTGVDEVENLIRTRLASVQVIDV